MKDLVSFEKSLDMIRAGILSQNPYVHTNTFNKIKSIIDLPYILLKPEKVKNAFCSLENYSKSFKDDFQFDIYLNKIYTCGEKFKYSIIYNNGAEYSAEVVANKDSTANGFYFMIRYESNYFKSAELLSGKQLKIAEEDMEIFIEKLKSTLEITNFI